MAKGWATTRTTYHVDLSLAESDNPRVNVVDELAAIDLAEAKYGRVVEQETARGPGDRRRSRERIIADFSDRDSNGPTEWTEWQ